MTKKWNIIDPEDFGSTEKEYNIGGKKYMRVTRTLGVISKPGLLIWFQKVGKRKADTVIKNRQGLGTTVHKIIELILRDEKPSLKGYNDEILEDIKLFNVFQKEARLRVEAVEQHLWSNKYRYAGTADYFGKYTTPERFLVRGHKAKFPKSSFVVGDWKTSRSVYPEYWLQAAAYAYAFYELTGIKVDGAFIAHFRFSKLKIREKTWDELMDLFKVYKHALGLYKWKYPNALK